MYSIINVNVLGSAKVLDLWARTDLFFASSWIEEPCLEVEAELVAVLSPEVRTYVVPVRGRRGGLSCCWFKAVTGTVGGPLFENSVVHLSAKRETLMH